LASLGRAVPSVKPALLSDGANGAEDRLLMSALALIPVALMLPLGPVVSGDCRPPDSRPWFLIVLVASASKLMLDRHDG
jgi:hypothetical protein